MSNEPSIPFLQPPLETQKRPYQTPKLEQHQFLILTGVVLSIGGFSTPTLFEELQ